MSLLPGTTVYLRHWQRDQLGMFFPMQVADDREDGLLLWAPAGAQGWHFNMPDGRGMAQTPLTEWSAARRVPVPHAIDHGLTEALTNAILHGALDLGSNMRDAADAQQDNGYQRYLELATDLPRRPGFTDRQVELQVARNADAFGIRISWDGSPCPPDARTAVVSDLTATDIESSSKPALRSSGMGMHIIYALFDRVVWDADGKGMELWLDRPTSLKSNTG